MTNVSCVSDNYEDPLESLIIVVDMLVKRNFGFLLTLFHILLLGVNFRSVALCPWDGMEF
jgi:hypothetical protein